MKNELGVPVPGWTVVASWTGWGVVVLAAIAATVSEFSTGVLLVVIPIVAATSVLLGCAYLAAAESRRQTAVVRGSLHYRWGERPRSWRWHGVWTAAVVYVAVVQLWFALDDGSVEVMVRAILNVLVLGTVAVLSTRGKWRRERRVRRAPGPVEPRAAPPSVPPVVRALPPKPLRGA
ncbi:MAG: hypothetical protein PIR53_09960 [Nocardioides alkalitolerans]